MSESGVEAMVTRSPDAATLRALRPLLDAAFDGRFSDDDWAHALGGVHVLLREDGELVGHGSVVERQLSTQGITLLTGYVEAVAVRPDRQGSGLGALLMDAVERELESGDYALGALSSSRRAIGFYRARGWQQWLGPTSVRTPAGIVRTPEDDGGVYVLDVDLGFDLFAGLTCDWREGDVW
ncbi:GNAT family N-acetyltransferase [Streptacidiphilus cavernicola]|uniref:GNAT family N-acetyltransferase n=1 Tax=Streptacidiphilus cavernicola TaxID=3342716 RepID=A0ABV6VRH1_9ACTN